jgi:hypothetical protein
MNYFIGTIISFVILALIGMAGWISNIVQICYMMNDPITGMFVFKCVGVLLMPLGSILGIIGWF